LLPFPPTTLPHRFVPATHVLRSRLFWDFSPNWFYLRLCLEKLPLRFLLQRLRRNSVDRRQFGYRGRHGYGGGRCRFRRLRHRRLGHRRLRHLGLRLDFLRPRLFRSLRHLGLRGWPPTGGLQNLDLAGSNRRNVILAPINIGRSAPRWRTSSSGLRFLVAAAQERFDFDDFVVGETCQRRPFAGDARLAANLHQLFAVDI
jgi:hypothetical protein